MKKLLMLQSLSPLALLTVIRNFSFCVPGNDGEEIVLGTWITLFLKSNLVLIIIFFLCLVWVIAAVWSFIKFTAFKWVDKKSGYQVINIEEKEDASLNFFMTMIIPLLIDDVGSIQGAITFIIIIVMMCTLLERTNLFYANPVLAILGYCVYEFTFVSNDKFKSEKCIGLVHGKLKGKIATIEYKCISERVMYIKEMR